MKKIFKKLNKNTGMTLIELLVVCVIFVIISSISIFNYNKFNSHISLQNLADDIALSVRKAQSFAVGAKGIGEVDGFDYSYGITFSITPNTNTLLPLPSSKSFVIFTDTTRSKSYNYNSSVTTPFCGSPSNNNECLEFLKIRSTDVIKNVNIYQGGSNPTLLGSNEYLNISFKRPNPEAVFCYQKGSFNQPCQSVNISHIDIIIEDTGVNPKTKTISVWSTGQININ